MKDILITPNGLKQSELTKMIETHVSQTLGEDTDIWIQRPFTMYTFAVRTLTAAVQILGDVSKRFGITEIPLWPNLIVSLSTKEADEEKDGNLNVVFDRANVVPLNEMKDFISEVVRQNGENSKTTKLRNPDDRNEEELIRRINSTANRDLQEKNAIIAHEPDMAVLITAYFLSGMFEILEQKAKETGHTVMYNLGDVIEITAAIRKGDVIMRILPGVCAKLTIKQDSYTEER